MSWFMSGRQFGWPSLAGALAVCLAAPALGDEIQYLPDGAHILVSVNVQTVLKSKAFQELKTAWLMQTKENINLNTLKMIGDELGVPVNNIARFTLGVAVPEEKFGFQDAVQILTVVKPVTADDIKSTRKRKGKLTYKEFKVGAFTIYQETYLDDKGNLIPAEAFCVAESKIVLVGNLASLQGVLERNKMPKLSATMTAGRQSAPFANCISVVVDVQNLPASAKEDVVGGKGAIPGLKDAIEKVQTFAVTVNEVGGKVKIAALLACQDKDSAAKARKVADDGLAGMKAKLKAPPDAPEQIHKLIAETSALIDAVKVTLKGKEVRLDLTADPGRIATTVIALISVTELKESAGQGVKEEPK
jgi:hypothetical protein